MADKMLTYGPDNFDQLLTTTLSTWAKDNLEDQVFNAMPLYKKMYGKAMKKDGGASILIPVSYEKNGTVQAYSEYDILDTTPQSGYTQTQAKWKNYAVSIAISGDQLSKNAGASKVIDLLSSKTDQAVQSLRDTISAGLFAASPGSTELDSLVTMIDATSTIQDVNSTSNSWWQSTVTTGGSFATQGLDDMRTTNDTIDEYNPSSMIDTIVTTKAIKNYYEASQTTGIRYVSRGTGDPTFGSLAFRGAEVFSDPNATSGVIYMFSTDNLFLVVNSNSDFKTTEFVKPSDQDAKIAQIILRLTIATNARRKLGKINTVTA